MKTEPVLITQHSTSDDHVLCEITLNNEATLHALNLEMLQLIDDALDQCLQDTRVVAVLINSTGERAFCAGGDVVAVYHAVKNGQTDQVEAYFETEYQLDYRIRTFPLPVIAWGDGLVLGGGLGIFHASSHRIVTSRSRLSMPEAGIGLYPDVGGSWFLNRLPREIGLFLGLTGHMINCIDARELDFADWAFPANSYPQLLNALQYAKWEGRPENETVTNVLYELTCDLPECTDNEAQISGHLLWLRQLMSAGNLQDRINRVLDIQQTEGWFSKAQSNLQAASPLSLCLIDEQLQRSRHWSLRRCLRSELSLSVKICLEGDFAEGIRALLIDKDKQPHWQYASLAEVERQKLDWLLEPLWPDAQIMG